VWIAGDYAAASVWIPPGGTELTDEEEAGIGSLLSDLAGSRAPELMELLERFDEAHPQTPRGERTVATMWREAGAFDYRLAEGVARPRTMRPARPPVTSTSPSLSVRSMRGTACASVETVAGAGWP
jgi:hypothetical protein